MINVIEHMNDSVMNYQLIDWAKQAPVQARLTRLTGHEAGQMNRAFAMNQTTKRYIRTDEPITSDLFDLEAREQVSQEQTKQTFTTSIRHHKAVYRPTPELM